MQFAKLRIPWLSWPIMRTFQVSSSGLDGRTFATQIPSFFGFGFNREKYRKKYRKAVQKENLRRRRQNVTEKLLLKIQNRSGPVLLTWTGQFGYEVFRYLNHLDQTCLKNLIMCWTAVQWPAGEPRSKEEAVFLANLKRYFYTIIPLILMS